MKNFIILLSLVMIVSCQVDAQKSINLETIDLGFSAEKYYENNKSLRKQISEDIKILSLKIESDPKNKDYKKKFKELVDKKYAINFIETSVWTVAIDETKEQTKENSKELLVEYEMLSHSTADSTACFKEVVFPVIDFFEESNGKFVALSARSNREIPTKDWFTSINKTLTKSFGQPKEKEFAIYDEYKFIEWKSDELVYVLVVSKEMKGSIRFFIVNKLHVNDIKQEFSEGSWRFLR